MGMYIWGCALLCSCLCTGFVCVHMTPYCMCCAVVGRHDTVQQIGCKCCVVAGRMLSSVPS